MDITQSEKLFLKTLSDDGSSPKLKRTLENCKLSCDLIEQSNEAMSKSSISRIGIANFGGPAYSTIANSNSKARMYVDLRIREYQTKLLSRPIRSTPFPDSKLDIPSLEFKRTLADLEQRNKLLQIMLEDLKERLTFATRGRPTRIGAAIHLGPDPVTGALQVPTDENSPGAFITQNSLNDEIQLALEVLRRILILIDDRDPLRSTASLSWQSHDGRRYLRAETEAEFLTLATQSETSVLLRLLHIV
ncbi:hypothetical protein THL1_5558 [Pseudomonas sp. TCU-HL1]|nr:hypothetical protein THL1_5558 [Pseudomonas sp. TCU-HL1]